MQRPPDRNGRPGQLRGPPTAKSTVAVTAHRTSAIENTVARNPGERGAVGCDAAVVGRTEVSRRIGTKISLASDNSMSVDR